MPKTRAEAGLAPTPNPHCSFCGSHERSVALAITSPIDDPMAQQLQGHINALTKVATKMGEEFTNNADVFEMPPEIPSQPKVSLKARICCNCAMAVIQQTFVHMAVIKDGLRNLGEVKLRLATEGGDAGPKPAG